MAVSLTTMREELMPGIRFACDLAPRQILRTSVPSSYVHIHNVFDVLNLKTWGDLRKLPDLIKGVDGTEYKCELVFAGREYDQGWGRTRNADGSIYHGEDAGPDGKVDTFKHVRNPEREALDCEIDDLITKRLG